MNLQKRRASGMRFGFLGLVGLILASAASAQTAPAVPDLVPAPAVLATPVPVVPAPVVVVPVVPVPVQAAPATPAPATPAPSAPAPATPAPATPAPATPAPATMVPPKSEIVPIPDANAATNPSIVPFQVAAKPVALIRGKASWEDGYKTIHDGFKKITDALAAEKINVIGKPMAVFIETNDADFKYELMVYVDKVPEGKTNITGDVVFGLSPAGKVLKFEHRGAYDDIDSTYEAITAYLDEKGYESKDLFAEEYLNEVKGSDDNALQVDVYVYLK